MEDLANIDDGEFDQALAALVRYAEGNGVDLEGGWTVDSADDDGACWNVEISKVVPESE